MQMHSSRRQQRVQPVAGSGPLPFLLSLTVLVAFLFPCARAEDNCSTQSQVSENREPGQYQNGTLQIQTEAKELFRPPSNLTLCLINDGAPCYPKSIELTAFLLYVQRELVPEGRSGGKKTDPDDLFYDDPDEDAREASIDRELQRELVESSDSLRSALCVSRNCDNVRHTCSPDVRPVFVWDYYNFNQIRAKIKNRRKDNTGEDSGSTNTRSSTSGNKAKNSGPQRLQLSLTVLWVTEVWYVLLSRVIEH